MNCMSFPGTSQLSPFQSFQSPTRETSSHTKSKLCDLNVCWHLRAAFDGRLRNLIQTSTLKDTKVHISNQKVGQNKLLHKFLSPKFTVWIFHPGYVVSQVFEPPFVCHCPRCWASIVIAQPQLLHCDLADILCLPRRLTLGLGSP